MKVTMVQKESGVTEVKESVKSVLLKVIDGARKYKLVYWLKDGEEDRKPSDYYEAKYWKLNSSKIESKSNVENE